MNEFKIAIRQLLKSPGFTAVAVLTLALGIGANTAIFTVIESVIMRPLPYPNPERLVQIWRRLPLTGEPFMSTGFQFKHWRDDATLLSGIAALDPLSLALTGDGQPEELQGFDVSASYLRVLGVRPRLGSDFAADADRVGGPNRTVIISHAFWRSHFGENPAVLQRAIRLGGVEYTIIGVLPPDVLPRRDVSFLRPLLLDDAADAWRMDPLGGWTVTLARMKPGVMAGQLSAELNRIHTAHLAEYPAEVKGLTPVVVPFREQLIGPMRPTLLMLSLAGLLVLLIASANVANLQLVRAIARRREIAVRIALGAKPMRIVRQLLGESLLLALAGGAVAVLFALYCTDLLASVAEAVQPQLSGLQRHISDKLTGGTLPPFFQPQVDWSVLGFSLGVVVVTTLVFGLVPALRGSRVNVAEDLSAARGSSPLRPRLQVVLVGAQVGLTTVLLIIAGLFMRSFSKVLAVNPGFDPAHTLAFHLVTPPTRYPTAERVVDFADDVLMRLAALPGVRAVGTITNPPFRGGWGARVGLATAPDRAHDQSTLNDYVSGEVLRALAIPLRRGRALAPADNLPGAAKVVVLNESLAHDLFGASDPLGKQIFWTADRWTVVGIAGDVRHDSLELAPRHHLYAPSIYRPSPSSVVVETAGSPYAVIAGIRETVQAIDPDQPLADLRPLISDVSRSLDPRRTNLALVGAFAAVALALAWIGIYGVLAFLVGQREREFGIRLALGAPGPRVLAMVLREGLRIALTGLGAGLLAAAAAGRFMGSLLFDLSPLDPAVYALVAAVLALAAAAACILPARRATRVDPLKALQAD